jgi:hypothetical protein
MFRVRDGGGGGFDDVVSNGDGSGSGNNSSSSCLVHYTIHLHANSSVILIPTRNQRILRQYSKDARSLARYYARHDQANIKTAVLDVLKKPEIDVSSNSTENNTDDVNTNMGMLQPHGFDDPWLFKQLQSHYNYNNNTSTSTSLPRPSFPFIRFKLTPRMMQYLARRPPSSSLPSSSALYNPVTPTPGPGVVSLINPDCIGYLCLVDAGAPLFTPLGIPIVAASSAVQGVEWVRREGVQGYIGRAKDTDRNVAGFKEYNLKMIENMKDGDETLKIHFFHHQSKITY